jgi:hypothetical protein
VYKVLVGEPEGKRPHGRPRRRWEDGIRVDLRKVGGGVDSVDSGQEAVEAAMNTVTNLGVV